MRSDTTQPSRTAWPALGAALLMLSAWSVADDTTQATGKTDTKNDTITPDMVRRISGPTKPDNGVVDVQPGMPAKKCAKEDKAGKDQEGDHDKKPEKTGRRKGHC